MSTANHRPSKAGTSRTKGRKVDEFEAGNSFVMVRFAYLSDSTLTHRQKILLIALESWAWDDDHCWPGNSEIARRCGWLTAKGKPAVDTVQEVLQELEAKGRIRRDFAVVDGIQKRERITILGTRTRDRQPAKLGATGPLEPGGEVPPGGVDLSPTRGVNSPGVGGEVPGELDSGNQTQAVDPGQQTHALFEDNVAAGGRVGADLVRKAAKLRSMIERLMGPGLTPGRQQMQVTGIARWLVSTLIDDEQWRGRYCLMLQRVLKGELSPDLVLGAFDYAYVHAAENWINDMGPAFLASIQSAETRAVSDDELVAEHRAAGGLTL